MNEIQPRSDGFSQDGKRLFIVALRSGESVLAACALVGISNRTAYNHRNRDPAFARDWRLARQMSRMPLEIAAYQRGVIGIEEPIHAYGRRLGTRVRRSDSLLRTLLIAERPKKYGPRAGIKSERKRAEKRIEAAVAPLRAALEAAQAELAALKAAAVEAAPLQIVNFVNPRAGGPATPSRETSRHRRGGKNARKPTIGAMKISELLRSP
jgi:hypothetical protein